MTALPLLEAFSLSEISESSFSASFNFATCDTKIEKVSKYFPSFKLIFIILLLSLLLQVFRGLI
jgi:hypothetical protein